MRKGIKHHDSMKACVHSRCEISRKSLLYIYNIEYKQNNFRLLWGSSAWIIVLMVYLSLDFRFCPAFRKFHSEAKVRLLSEDP